ncbi:hypothetical protein Taro_029420 [Colocasia esculenta]|uniref:aldehyde oxygenase (deformylating) n=1 Tax=Colocasia esculenta TaxID=4460 RepID=A0A843VX50_COLES|nr:hypothetical protein [Colocasia esculenta]
MAFGVSEEVLGIFTPTVVYWLYSGIYVLMGPMEKHRLFTKEEEEAKNLVSKKEVVLGVLVEQATQIVTLALVAFSGVGTTSSAADQTSISALLAAGWQLLIALLVMDAWQYWGHRYFHLNKFMYKHIHARHHRLIVPYAYGALYNHPLESFLLNTLGGAVALVLSGMSPRTSMIFFVLSTVKNVDDHCGLWFPGHPFHKYLLNNSAFHAVHHQLYGNKYNFSTPFLVVWDKLLGTYLPCTVEERKGGGYEIRAPVMKDD